MSGVKNYFSDRDRRYERRLQRSLLQSNSTESLPELEPEVVNLYSSDLSTSRSSSLVDLSVLQSEKKIKNKLKLSLPARPYQSQLPSSSGYKLSPRFTSNSSTSSLTERTSSPFSDRLKSMRELLYFSDNTEEIDLNKTISPMAVNNAGAQINENLNLNLNENLNQNLNENLNQNLNRNQNINLNQNMNHNLGFNSKQCQYLLNSVPHFDGRHEDLERYTDACTYIMEMAANDADHVNLVPGILQIVKGKLTGKAYTAGRTCRTWAELKTTLDNYFLPYISKEEMEDKISNIKFESNVERMSEYVQRLNLLNKQYTDLLVSVEGLDRVVAVGLANNTIKRAFIKGLNEPLRSIINSNRAQELSVLMHSAIEQNHYDNNYNHFNQAKSGQLSSTDNATMQRLLANQEKMTEYLFAQGNYKMNENFNNNVQGNFNPNLNNFIDNSNQGLGNFSGHANNSRGYNLNPNNIRPNFAINRNTPNMNYQPRNIANNSAGYVPNSNGPAIMNNNPLVPRPIRYNKAPQKVTFNTAGAPRCYRCNTLGHIAMYCPLNNQNRLVEGMDSLNIDNAPVSRKVPTTNPFYNVNFLQVPNLGDQP